jgi:hypothetical protein
MRVITLDANCKAPPQILPAGLFFATGDARSMDDNSLRGASRQKWLSATYRVSATPSWNGAPPFVVLPLITSDD